MHTKYLKETGNKQQLSGALNGSRWRFLKNGMDDFRDGYPPLRGDDYFIPNQKGPRPVVHGEPVSLKQQPRKRFTKEQVCYSKQTPLQQARGEYIEEIEYGLTQHPLALYPHLEEGLPPEVRHRILYTGNIQFPEKLRTQKLSFAVLVLVYFVTALLLFLHAPEVKLR